MPDFPFSKTLEFIRTVVPFDTLSQADLEQLAGQMEMVFYLTGETVIHQGDPPPSHLRIIQRGAARIHLQDDSGEICFVDVRGEGEVFGVTSILKGKEALFDITVTEDMIAYQLPAATFRQLVEQNPTFKRTFGLSLARILKSVRKACDGHFYQLAGIRGIDHGMYLVRNRVADMMVADVQSCSPATTIRAAAQQMSRHHIASLVVRDLAGAPIGIVTDQNLRADTLAEGRSPEEPVSAIMSSPLRTIGPDALAFDALLEMSHQGISHLPVVEDGRLVGMITQHDFLMETGSSPVGVIADIEKAQTLEQLVALRAKVDNVREVLFRQGGSVKKMTELVSEVNDRITSKIITLTQERVKQEGLGEPPTRFCWISLGSEGRLEQTLKTDQDNAIAYVSPPAGEEESTKKWFLDFAERVVEGLVLYGFPRCRGGIMASNPKWCDTEQYWLDTFLSWVNDPNPLALRMASIFFDFRALYSQTAFTDTLRSQLNQAMDRNSLFLRLMAKNALYNVPPLGFLKTFVVEKSGEHKNELNLKMKGSTPIVEAARVLALDLKISATNTLDRLAEICERNVIDDEFHADLQEAYCFINYLRIHRHLEARAKGVNPNNFIDPATLNNLQRKMLKESFRIINRLQEMIQHRYQTQSILEG